jgi:molybdopterin synthase catalytic subunit
MHQPRQRFHCGGTSDGTTTATFEGDLEYDAVVEVPATGEDWVGISSEPLPVAEALDWAHRPDCGAVVLFSGVARDHSADRSGVDRLEYEAYEAQVTPRLAALAADARTRWPALGRLVMIHRVGELVVGDSAVIVVASSPHRPEAFAAARFCIDALKATIPIWKRERWDAGESWGLEAQHIVEVDDLNNAMVAADGSVTLPDGPLPEQ